MLIRNAMNKIFQQSWMPHTTIEQPGVDKDSEHGRTRSEDRKNKDRKKTDDGALDKDVRTTRGGRQLKKPKRYL